MTDDKLRDDRKRGFYILDNDLIDKYGPHIGVYGVAVYNLIARYADGSGENAFPSYQTIANKLGISRPKAVTTINLLVELGLIRKEKRNDSAGDATSNIYTISDMAGGKPHLPPSKPHLPQVVNNVNQGGKPRLPDQDTINKTQIEEEDQNETTGECDNEKLPPSSLEEPLPLYLQPGYQDPMLAAAQDKFNKRQASNGRYTAGWQANLNLELAADKRVPLVNAIAKVCGLTKAMTDDETAKDVHTYAVKFYNAGCKTEETVNATRDKYLADAWRRQNHPKPSLASFFKFYSQQSEDEPQVEKSSVGGQIILNYSAV